MEIPVPIKQENYNKAIIKVLNTFIEPQMTDYEMLIVSTMLDNNIKVLNKQNRKALATLTEKDQYTFNNYIKRLKDKQVLIKQDNELIINPNIKNLVGETEINIKFNIT